MKPCPQGVNLIFIVWAGVCTASNLIASDVVDLSGYDPNSKPSNGPATIYFSPEEEDSAKAVPKKITQTEVAPPKPSQGTIDLGPSSLPKPIPVHPPQATDENSPSEFDVRDELRTPRPDLALPKLVLQPIPGLPTVIESPKPQDGGCELDLPEVDPTLVDPTVQVFPRIQMASFVSRVPTGAVNIPTLALSTDSPREGVPLSHSENRLTDEGKLVLHLQDLSVLKQAAQLAGGDVKITIKLENITPQSFLDPFSKFSGYLARRDRGNIILENHAEPVFQDHQLRMELAQLEAQKRQLEIEIADLQLKKQQLQTGLTSANSDASSSSSHPGPLPLAPASTDSADVTLTPSLE